MKKLLILLLVLIMPIGLLCGCGFENEEDIERENSSFAIIENVDLGNCYSYMVMVHKDTKVMYLWTIGYYKSGLTVMLNADGTPMIWEGEL